ncbi:MAG: GNAT family N-acetyltransferase [Saprospiraceae bacterium]
MSTIQIRSATLEDLPVLLLFEQGVIKAERPFDLTLKADPIHYYDLEKLISGPDSIVLVAVDKGQLIASGYADIRKAKLFYKYELFAYLGFMYVKPEYRGKQIIRLILRGLRDWCETKQINELRLEVYSDNVSAINAYVKEGFSKNLIEMGLSLNKS